MQLQEALMLQGIKNNQNEKLMNKSKHRRACSQEIQSESRFPGQVRNGFAHVVVWQDSFGPIWSPWSSDLRTLKSVMSFTGQLYLCNVLRAFLRGGYTQRTGRTGSRGGGSDPQAAAAAVCLKTASKAAARLPCSRSSCSDSSWPHGAPCPGRPWESAPGWTACSSARQPVSAFRIQIFGALRICAGFYLLNTHIRGAEEVYSKHKGTLSASDYINWGPFPLKETFWHTKRISQNFFFAETLTKSVLQITLFFCEIHESIWSICKILPRVHNEEASKACPNSFTWLWKSLPVLHTRCFISHSL